MTRSDPPFIKIVQLETTMDLCRMRYFLAVCEHGSFTAAAKSCGVSQPAVTTGVARLERALGGKLFERRHPVRLTPFGEKMRPLLESLQAAADRIAAAIALGEGVAAADTDRGGLEIRDRTAPPDLPLFADVGKSAELLLRSSLAIARADREPATIAPARKPADQWAAEKRHPPPQIDPTSK